MRLKEKTREQELRFDQRLIKMNLRRGVIKSSDLDGHLKGLPDEEANAEYVQVYEEPPPEEATPHFDGDELTFT